MLANFVSPVSPIQDVASNVVNTNSLSAYKPGTSQSQYLNDLLAQHESSKPQNIPSLEPQPSDELNGTNIINNQLEESSSGDIGGVQTAQNITDSLHHYGSSTNSLESAASSFGDVQNPRDLIGQTSNPSDTSSTQDPIGNDVSVSEGVSQNSSLSQFFQDNPGVSMEDALKYMAQHSDEYAEKYMDYILEKESIREANEYTASREDSAYQRLVQDLKKAGLNPAMMYGSSANTTSSGSAGVVNMTSGANNRSVSNYTKIKQMLLQYMAFEFQKAMGITNSVVNGLTSILGMFL